MNHKMKFNPQQIHQAATVLKNANRQLLQEVDAIEDIRNKIVLNWESDAAQLYNKEMKELKVKATRLISRLSDYESKLVKASGIYQSSEKDAVKKSEGLPTTGVFKV